YVGRHGAVRAEAGGGLPRPGAGHPPLLPVDLPAVAVAEGRRLQGDAPGRACPPGRGPSLAPRPSLSLPARHLSTSTFATCQTPDGPQTMGAGLVRAQTSVRPLHWPLEHGRWEIGSEMRWFEEESSSVLKPSLFVGWSKESLYS